MGEEQFGKGKQMAYQQRRNSGGRFLPGTLGAVRLPTTQPRTTIKNAPKEEVATVPAEPEFRSAGRGTSAMVSDVFAVDPKESSVSKIVGQRRVAEMNNVVRDITDKCGPDVKVVGQADGSAVIVGPSGDLVVVNHNSGAEEAFTVSVTHQEYTLTRGFDEDEVSGEWEENIDVRTFTDRGEAAEYASHVTEDSFRVAEREWYRKNASDRAIGGFFPPNVEAPF